MSRTKRAVLFTVCCRYADNLQNVCGKSAEYRSAKCPQSVCSDDLQQVCKFADALQTKSAYHVKQRAHKMHQSNNAYLKDRIIPSLGSKIASLTKYEYEWISR